MLHVNILENLITPTQPPLTDMQSQIQCNYLGKCKLTAKRNVMSDLLIVCVLSGALAASKA